MDPIGILVIGALCLVGLFLVVRMPLAILGNMQIGRRFREQLGDRLDGLRLKAMLKRRGIDEGAYLHQTPVVNIQNQMQRCSGCQATARCDSHLANSGESVEAAGEFCPNDGELRGIEIRPMAER